MKPNIRFSHSASQTLYYSERNLPLHPLYFTLVDIDEVPLPGVYF